VSEIDTTRGVSQSSKLVQAMVFVVCARCLLFIVQALGVSDSVLSHRADSASSAQ
jgi:hypothetical protein